MVDLVTQSTQNNQIREEMTQKYPETVFRM